MKKTRAKFAAAKSNDLTDVPNFAMLEAVFGSANNMSPEEKLFFGMLDVVLMDLNNKEYRSDCKKWLRDRRYDAINSFVGVCLIFDLKNIDWWAETIIETSKYKKLSLSGYR